MDDARFGVDERLDVSIDGVIAVGLAPHRKPVRERQDVVALPHREDLNRDARRAERGRLGELARLVEVDVPPLRAETQLQVRRCVTKQTDAGVATGEAHSGEHPDDAEAERQQHRGDRMLSPVRRRNSSRP